MMVLVGSICIPFSLLETVVRYFILGTTAYLLLSQYIHTFYICMSVIKNIKIQNSKTMHTLYALLDI